MAAIGLLPGGQPVDGTLEPPPPLLGRAEALFVLARAGLGQGRSLVVAADDPSDREAAFAVLGCAAALEHHSLMPMEGAFEERALLSRGPTEGRGSLVGLAGSADGAILAEALVEASTGTAGILVGIVTSEQAHAAKQALGPSAAERVDWHVLPPVPLEALEGHLGSRATLSSAEVVGALARDLHLRTEGWQSAIEVTLSQAESIGVARHLNDGWMLQRDRWPTGPLPRPDEELGLEGADSEDVSLDLLDAMRREGRLAAARSLADRFEVSRSPLASDVAARLCLLRAELDLAEGSIDTAAERLRVEEVLAQSHDPDVVLRANVGAAHLTFLSGDFAAVRSFGWDAGRKRAQNLSWPSSLASLLVAAAWPRGHS